MHCWKLSVRNKTEFRQSSEGYEEREWNLLSTILKPTKESPVCNNMKCGTAPYSPQTLWRVLENRTLFTSTEATSKAMALQDNVHIPFKTKVPHANTASKYLYSMIDENFFTNLRNLLKAIAIKGKLQLEVDASCLRTREGSLPCLAMNCHLFQSYDTIPPSSAFPSPSPSSSSSSSSLHLTCVCNSELELQPQNVQLNMTNSSKEASIG